MYTEFCNTAEQTIRHLWLNFLEPAYKEGVRNNKLPLMPTVAKVVDWAHPLKGHTDWPLNKPGQLAFNSRLLKFTFLHYRHVGMHHYHEVFNCAPKVFDDVTSVNSISFNSLQSNQEVEQVWMNQGSIKYRMKDSPEVVNTVMDPFSLSHPHMSKRPIP